MVENEKTKNSHIDVASILRRFAVMKNERERFEPMWNKASELCSLNSELLVADQRGRIKQTIFDSTARNALTCFAASMKSVIVPTTTRWHRLKATDYRLKDDPEVRKYLERVTDLLFNIRYAANSNFSVQSDVLFNQLGVYGHAVWMVEDDIGKGIIYRTIPIKEAYIQRNDRGQLVAVFREYELSATEALAEFHDQLPAEVKLAAANYPERKFKFLHAVYEKDGYRQEKKDFNGMRFASIHLEMGSKKVVKESGYRNCPYMAPRFLGIAGSSYGDSPAMQAFYDMLTANEMGKTILRTGQLQANPPILTNMGLIDANKLGSAGAVIRGGLDNQGRPAAVSMQYGNNLAITAEMQHEVRAAIERAFLVPLFQSLRQSKQMTATEVEKREVEKSMLLAPMCERISAEWLNGNIEREMDILSQYGALDDVPDALMKEGAIAIEYVSPAVHMQESNMILGVYKTMEAAITMAQINPQVLDLFDVNQALRKVADYHGVDSRVVRDDEEIKLQKLHSSMENAVALQTVEDNPLIAAMNSLKR